ncbi:MAG: nitrate reductase subunit beta [Deltaproteobacteria bacterium]|nr:nitrate reductase subunit beta [Deltaproteobacteria bacterium]
MKIKAQLAMVMNLDKCIGCHTCSIPCKHVWTNREGAEYIWYNNVETKPGIGYPKHWENQGMWQGGWAVNKDKLDLKAGGRMDKLLKIFHNPNLPQIDAYYEPWTYDYECLTKSPLSKYQPATRPKSLITGENLEIDWGPNWEDDLAGAPVYAREDINFGGLEREVYLRFKNVFMFWLPRICEHCLNPACLASCPQGAIYKRDEDGIVLLDQEKCRGWSFCVSGCPYKKSYFNWHTHRSEKCIFCYPRIEAGLPTLCAESCVGRIRYIGVMLYDADRLQSAAATGSEQELYPAQTALFLNPHDPEVAAAAAKAGISPNFIEAARRSPVYKLIDWKLALPPHPEFRTLPMVWYIPPLSPLVGASAPEPAAADLERLRIPLQYLANLLAAGDQAPVKLALQRLLALRQYMRSVNVDQTPDAVALETAGLSEETAREMYHLLAIANYHDRFVVPTVRKAEVEDLYKAQGEAGFPPGSAS